MAQCWVNGKEIEMSTAPQILTALLAPLGLSTKGILLECNGDAVPHDKLETFEVCDGDHLEIVRAFAGG